MPEEGSLIVPPRVVRPYALAPRLLSSRWREYLTAHFVERWMGPCAFDHRELHHQDTDNPDQRTGGAVSGAIPLR